MARYLWLVFERPPHPEAVVHPASEGELRMVMVLLSLPYRDRARLGQQLQNWLRESRRSGVFDRAPVAVRFGEGLYQPIGWRLAKWLAHVLPIGDGGARSTVARIRHWLETEPASHILTLK